jgi:hypothetical protein
VLFYSKIWFNTPQLAAVERKPSMGVSGIKTDVIINFLSNEPPFRNSTTLKIPQSLLCGGSLFMERGEKQAIWVPIVEKFDSCVMKDQK